MYKRFYKLIIVCILLVFVACSEKKSCDLAILNVKLFDGERAIENCSVYIQNGAVLAIDTQSTSGQYRAKISIDGLNKTLIPALINSHVHIQSRENLKFSAQAGILTVMELLRLEEDSIKVFKALANSAMYPDFYSSGIGVDMPNAVIKQYIQSLNPYAPKTTKDIEDFIALRIKNGADFIKVFQDSRLPEKFNDAMFDKAISEIHKNKMLAIVHSETLRDTRYEFEHGADIVAHAWVDSLIDEGLLKHWKERDFSIIPTLWVHLSVKRTYQPKNYLLSEEQLIQEVGKLHKAGIRILAGSDSPADNLNFTTDFYKELELYNQAGLSPLEVLQTSTINPAKVFKLKDKGVIRVGVSADMVLVNGDILKDLSRIHNIEGVWKKGLRIK